MNNAFLTLTLAASLAVAGDYEPISNYAPTEIQGWKLLVNRRLISDEPEIHKQTMKLLEVKLYDINRVVPARQLSELHKVPIWVELDDDHRFPCICYHVSSRWLTENGFNPEKEGAVEICNAKQFLNWTHGQPWLLMHEMAHAYHHRVLGRTDPLIQAAYRQALANKTYDSVLRYHGIRERHYGLKSAREYFAESTEAYFGVNDFYPFTRAELKHHDPHMYRLLREIWGDPPLAHGGQ